MFVHPKAQSCLIKRVNIQEKSDQIHLSSVWLKGVLVVLSIFHIGQNLSVSTINMKWNKCVLLSSSYFTPPSKKLQHCQIFLSYCLIILMSPLVLKGLLGSVPESPHDAFREFLSKLKTIIIILITTTIIRYYFLCYHFLIVQKQRCVKVLTP